MKIFEIRDANSTSDGDRSAIRETVYLLSVPGMRESVKAGMAQLPENLAKSLDW